MPEGDVVWLAARRLHEALAGRPLTLSDFRVPRFATADLRGREVHEARSRGKHILIRVEGGLTVHTHLLMEGRWRIRRPGPRPRDHRIRLVLANAEWQALGYSLGLVELLRTAAEDRVLGHLGPDLLGPDWGAEAAAEAVRRLGERPDRAIGEALLDQSVLAGIGNIYKAETLFLCGVNPWTPVAAVPDLPAVVDLAHHLLDANKEQPGRMTTGNRRRGWEYWVYRRAGRPCHECRTPVQRAVQKSDVGDRATYWCPRCQPAPSNG
ncbi:DNA-formamidopyrimidine glycosylase family protein [Actinomadura terrae]|uniref:DNA-formamidopyrimidine glycosylase family protein n=1 Tax=Actinomadura terrae TaxID=604353 RepID=UPI001FA7725B|nr:DNA-formamidopyrimidine glycosylase family protein [Actinomadura terrae]